MAHPSVPGDCIYNQEMRRRIRPPFSMVWFFLVGPQLFRLLLPSHLDPYRLASAVCLLVGVAAVLWDAMMTKAVRDMAKVEKEVRPQLEEKHAGDFSGMTHVGISPGKAVRSYEGDSSWDIGYLSLDSGLTFWGDQCQFHIPRRFIQSATVVEKTNPHLRLCFDVPGRGEEWMNIEARRAQSRMDQYATLQRIRTRIALMRDDNNDALALPAF
jgi:hypothetical protein